MKVISGGQTGVDQTALRTARAFGYETGGTAARGWKTDAGPSPWLADYGLVECRFNGYRPRTIQNVIDADCTVWFGDRDSPGGRLTLSTCVRLEKRYLVNPTATELCAALETVKVLNVAGNRLRINPAASAQAHQVLKEALAPVDANSRLKHERQTGDLILDMIQRDTAKAKGRPVEEHPDECQCFACMFSGRNL